MSRANAFPQRVNFLDESRVDEILQIIPNLLSEDNRLRAEGEKKFEVLSTWNFYLCCLMKLIADENVSQDIRIFCCITFKNAIDKYWRKHAPYTIIQEERNKIHKEIISLAIRIKSDQLLSLLAIAISKISRIDFPEVWPNLVEELVSYINSNDESIRLKAIIILNEIVKQLGTKKLMESKTCFRKLTSDLSGFICQIWTYYLNHTYRIIEAYIAGPMDSNASFSTDLQLSPYLKGVENTNSILGNFIDHGMPSLEPWTINFYNELFGHLKRLYSFFEECRKRGIRNLVTDSVVRIIRRLLRPIMYGITRHPLDFGCHLESSIGFAYQVIMTSAPEVENSDHYVEEEYDLLLIRFLTLITLILNSTAYSKAFSQNTSQKVLEVQSIIFNKCLNIDVLAKLATRLISVYMILTPQDMDLWSIDPEEFLREQDSDSDGTLKGTAESLFMSILDSDEDVCQKFAELIQELIIFTRNCNGDHEKTLIREAAFSALGWGSYYLYQHIDFKQLFSSQLYAEITNKSTDKYIVRRLIWVLGRWTEKMDEEMRMEVYKTLNQLIHQVQGDTVLYLTILYTLADMVDDYYFQYKELEPYLASFTEHMFRICNASMFEDAKLRLLPFLTAIMPHSPNQSYVLSVLDQLQKMWNTNTSFLIQTSILALMKEIIQVLSPENLLKNDSVSFVIRLIMAGVNPEEGGHVYYYEESLDLYKSALTLGSDENMTIHMNKTLLPVCSFVFHALERSSEYIMQSAQLFEQHIIINCEEFLKLYANQLSAFIYSTIGNFKSQTIHQITVIMQKILDKYPSEGSQIFYTSLCKILWAFLNKDEEVTVLVEYAIILCQVLLFNKTQFQNVIQEVASSKSKDLQEIFFQMCEIILENFDQMWSLYHRRVVVLALLSIYPGNNIRMVELLPSILLFASQLHGEELSPNFPQEIRESPVIKANLTQHAQQVLQHLQNSFGSSIYMQLKERINIDVQRWLGL